ncbi:extensin family protein [Jannaschia sp. 2305UL9-9]|uniref:extensin-like domain-containing protein n=1 Tax=Jannaschia sp. 2305UL9-9 TaxID=3121638 RepID=UPI003526CC4D
MHIGFRLEVVVALIWGGHWLLTAPDTPLPDHLNPLEPLDLSQPAGALTSMKLRRAQSSGPTCRAALATGAAFEDMAPLVSDTVGCGIDTRVLLRRVGAVDIAPLETSCNAALSLAAWEAYSLRSAAQTLGAPIVRISHQGSYNCRPIRGGTRLSSHATAMAIDVRAVTLSDGRDLPLLGNWDGPDATARFWRAARDGACRWFTTVLGPEFNAAHADHLHLQSNGWGTCR